MGEIVPDEGEIAVKSVNEETKGSLGDSSNSLPLEQKTPSYETVNTKPLADADPNVVGNEKDAPDSAVTTANAYASVASDSAKGSKETLDDTVDTTGNDTAELGTAPLSNSSALSSLGDSRRKVDEARRKKRLLEEAREKRDASADRSSNMVRPGAYTVEKLDERIARKQRSTAGGVVVDERKPAAKRAHTNANDDGAVGLIKSAGVAQTQKGTSSLVRAVSHGSATSASAASGIPKPTGAVKSRNTGTTSGDAVPRPGAFSVQNSMDRRFAEKQEASSRMVHDGNQSSRQNEIAEKQVGSPAVHVDRKQNFPKDENEGVHGKATIPIGPGAFAVQNSMDKRIAKKQAVASVDDDCKQSSHENDMAEKQAAERKPAASTSDGKLTSAKVENELSTKCSGTLPSVTECAESLPPIGEYEESSIPLSRTPMKHSPGAFQIAGPGVDEEDLVDDTEEDDLFAVKRRSELEFSHTPIAAFAVHEPETAARQIEKDETVRQIIMDSAPVVDGEVMRTRSEIHAQAGSQTSSRKWFRENPRRCMIIVLLAIGAVIAVIVGVVVSSSGSGTDESPNATQIDPTLPTKSPSSAPTASPTESPSSAPTSERFGLIRSALSSVSDVEVLDDRSTPQHKAMVWLADEDDNMVDWKDESNLYQRFALATLYFSTGGVDSWIHKYNFLSSDHFCAWNETVPEKGELGVFCTGEAVDKIVLATNNLTGSLPEEIGLLSSLRSVSMEDNVLSGPIPSALVHLSSLEVVNFEFNGITGFLPNSIGNLSHLKSFRMASNDLYGSIPSSVNNLTSLEVFFFPGNSLNGTIPFTANSLPNLVDFNVAFNSLTGTLPTSLFSLTSLKALFLQGNSLHGTLPSEVGNLDELRVLNLGGNGGISGSLPKTIARPTGLLLLSVWGNMLNHTIPDEIGNLTDLRALYLDNNQLSGTIPRSLGNLVKLGGLKLEFNSLNGTVPLSFANLTSLISLEVNNNTLSGSLDFLCNTSIGFMMADCYGTDVTPAEISCECCKFCCSDYHPPPCFPN